MFRPTKEAPPPPGIRLFRVELDVFASEADRAYSERALDILLVAVSDINLAYMKAHPPGTPRALPPIYKSGVAYTREGLGTDERWQDARSSYLRKRADCLPEGTLVVKKGHELCPIEDVKVGDEILDGKRWVKVLNWWDKGTLPVLSFQLNNGGVLRCTEDHRVFRVKRGPRDAPGTLDDVEEVRAGDLRPGDDLLQPGAIPFGEESYGPDKGLIVGAYVAEGFMSTHEGTIKKPTSGTTYFAISGIENNAISGIENNKGIRERCDAAAVRMGLHVAQAANGKYIGLSGDRDLWELLESAGHKGYKKRFPTLDVDRESVEAMLTGVNADGYIGSNGVSFIFSTSSPTLAIQYRLLQRMMGRSVSIVRYDEHGGLGTHPIYRIGVRGLGQQRTNSRPWAKIKAITASEQDERCYDIETESKRIYLPESDVIVHNCEDLSAWLAAEMRFYGKPARAFAEKREARGGGSIYHCLVRVPGEGVYDPSRVLGMLSPSEGEIDKESGRLHFDTPKAFVPEFPGAKPDPRWSGPSSPGPAAPGMSRPGQLVHARPLAVGGDNAVGCCVGGCACGGTCGGDCSSCDFAKGAAVGIDAYGAVADASLMKISERAVPGPAGGPVRGIYRVRLADGRLFLSREAKSLAGLRSKWSWEDQGPLTFWHLHALGRLDLAPRFRLARPPGPAPAVVLTAAVKGKRVAFRPKPKAPAGQGRAQAMPPRPRRPPPERETLPPEDQREVSVPSLPEPINPVDQTEEPPDAVSEPADPDAPEPQDVDPPAETTEGVEGLFGPNMPQGAEWSEYDYKGAASVRPKKGSRLFSRITGSGWDLILKKIYERKQDGKMFHLLVTPDRSKVFQAWSKNDPDTKVPWVPLSASGLSQLRLSEYMPLVVKPSQKDNGVVVHYAKKDLDANADWPNMVSIKYMPSSATWEAVG